MRRREFIAWLNGSAGDRLAQHPEFSNAWLLLRDNLDENGGN
jgi:hypothetical protein